MAGFSANSLIQSLSKPDFSSLVTKSPIVPVDRHHTSGVGGYHHHKSKGKGGKNVVLSALTLLSFMVFLNLLQSCLEQQMEYYNNNNTPQIVIMQSQRLKELREAEAQKRKGETLLDSNITATGSGSEELGNSPQNGGKIKSKGHNNIKTSPGYTQVPVKLKTIDKYRYP